MRTDDGLAVVAPIGTAFVVGQLNSTEAVLVTASHNVPDRLRVGESNLVILLPKRGGRPGLNELQGFIVSGVSIAETSSDVALLVVAIDDSAVMPALIPVGMEIPKVGENSLALGYSDMRIGQLTDVMADAPFHVSSSRGKIEVVYPSHRDAIKVTFPSFQTDAFYEQGMSGGPVLGTSGRAIGLVSTCMESSEEGVPHTSHVALLAGLLELPIPVEGSSEIKVADLADKELVSVDGVATVLTRTEGRVVVTWPDLGNPPT